MPHTRGTVIGAYSIGNFAIIYHGVTIGATFIDIKNSGEERPVIGDNVKIATGVVIVGKIQIGDNVAIGPNAVVRESVESNHMVSIDNRCMINLLRKSKENG
jgi:serine O-acetyltransferase